jgi:antitoxin component YwqK of YwqJK toxin-antitoxin module
VNGDVDGESTFNFTPKLPYSSIRYNNGYRHGIMKIYHLNGKLMVETNYVHGEKHGDETEYDKTGKLIFSRVYYNGEMISETKH